MLYIAGKYGILIPFYNSIFSGKVARMQIFNDDDPNMNLDMQVCVVFCVTLLCVIGFWDRLFLTFGRCDGCVW